MLNAPAYHESLSLQMKNEKNDWSEAGQIKPEAEL